MAQRRAGSRPRAVLDSGTPGPLACGVLSNRFVRAAVCAAAAWMSFAAASAPARAAVAEPALRLSLAEAVGHAVRNSRAIRDAALGRQSDRFDLYEAEAEFRPRLDLAGALDRREIELRNAGAEAVETRGDGAGFGAAVRLALPTGGEVAYAWASTRAEEQPLSPEGELVDGDGRTSAFTLRQPLLRGGGVGVATAALKRARLADEISDQEFRGGLMRVVTGAVRGYRALVGAERGLEIARRSLEQARELVVVNQALIEAGRMAAVDLIQTETQVANAEVELLAAENDLERARLALVDVLDLQDGTRLESAEPVTIVESELDLEALYRRALLHRPEQRVAELDLEIARLGLLEARNGRLWNLDLSASWGDVRDRPLGADDVSRERSWSAAVVVGHTLGDRSRERRFAQSRIEVERAELRLEELRSALRLELTDRVRDIEIRRRAVEVAERARGLSERQLEIESEKLRVGRSTNFEYLRLEDDLVVARLRELAATISYLDALTLLDEAVGTTLDTWGVTIDSGAGS